MKDALKGWTTDENRKPVLDRLTAQIGKDPALAQMIIKIASSYINPALPRCEDLLADPDSTWAKWSDEKNWPSQPDESLERQQLALVFLMKAGTNDPRWWEKHWPDEKNSGPYPHGQALYIQWAVELLMVDGVQLPYRIKELHGLKPPKAA